MSLTLPNFMVIVYMNYMARVSIIVSALLLISGSSNNAKFDHQVDVFIINTVLDDEGVCRLSQVIYYDKCGNGYYPVAWRNLKEDHPYLSNGYYYDIQNWNGGKIKTRAKSMITLETYYDIEQCDKRFLLLDKEDLDFISAYYGYWRPDRPEIKTDDLFK